MPTREEQIEELLIEWELAHAEGQPVTAEQLCADHPALLPDVEARLRVLDATSWMTVDASDTSHQGLGRDADGNTNDADANNDEPVLLPAADVMPAAALSPSDISGTELLRQIEQYELIRPATLAAWQRDSGAQPQGDASLLAQGLVEANLLTQYQAQVLLHQKDSPLLLDRYIILDVIGAGGMGVVFKALHRPMERIVALKVLPEHAVSSPQKVARFRREIRAAARLTHPNIVTALDAHEDRGIHFLVTEFVPGVNLYDEIRQSGPLPAEETLQLAILLAEALQTAHEAGIVHRDIKPGNIILTPDGVPKLLDLGLARVRDERLGTQAGSITEDAQVLGTVDYMAPEQALDAAQADARSDLYSLGCTLFYLLTGAPPYPSASPLKTLVAHREADVPSVAEHCADVPPRLAQAIEIMLSKEPDQRFADMATLARFLTEDTSPEDQPPQQQASEAGGGDVQEAANAGMMPSEIADGSAGSSPARLDGAASAESQPPVNVSPAVNRSRRWVYAAAGLALLGCAVCVWMLVAGGGKSDGAKLIEWVHSQDGMVSLRTDEITQEYSAEDPVPDGNYDIVGVTVTPDSSPIPFELLASIPSLTQLTLYYSEAGQVNCATINQLRQLELLDLSGTELDRYEFDLPKLRELHLGEVALPLSDFAGLDASPDLSVLAITATRATTRQVLDLLQRFALPKLHALHLDDTQVDDGIVEVFRSRPQLRSISLAGTQLTDSGLQQIALHSQLEQLDLGDTQTTHEGWQAIQDCVQLKSLSLANLPVTDEQIPLLLSLKKLQALFITDTQISSAGLLQLAKHQNLDQLYLSEGQFSEKVMAQFQKEAPYCDIFELSEFIE